MLDSQRQLALICFGNPLRGDDAIGAAIFSNLPEALKEKLAYYNLEDKACLIADCLHGRQTAIFIDAVKLADKPGTCHIVDLQGLLRQGSLDKIKISHALSWLDELKLLYPNLPGRLYFFGIEIADSGFSGQISSILKQQQNSIAAKLACLINTCLEWIESDA